MACNCSCYQFIGTQVPSGLPLSNQRFLATTTPTESHSANTYTLHIPIRNGTSTLRYNPKLHSAMYNIAELNFKSLSDDTSIDIRLLIQRKLMVISNNYNTSTYTGTFEIFSHRFINMQVAMVHEERPVARLQCFDFYSSEHRVCLKTTINYRQYEMHTA